MSACGEPMKVSVAAVPYAVSAPPGLELPSATPSAKAWEAQAERVLVACRAQAQLALQAQVLHAQACSQAMQALLYQSLRQAAPPAPHSSGKAPTLLEARRSTRKVRKAPPPPRSPRQEVVDIAGKTTVIVKKMPKAFTRALLLEVLDRRGFLGCYDFVYVPIHFDRMNGTGCAFINFVTTEVAERFMQAFRGFRDWGVASSDSKVAQLTWSQTCQGRDAHVERYRDSPVMHPSVPEEFRPLIFADGVRQPFPAPTRPLQPPTLV